MLKWPLVHDRLKAGLEHGPPIDPLDASDVWLWFRRFGPPAEVLSLEQADRAAPAAGLVAVADTIKSAKRMVERSRPVVWDVLEEVIAEPKNGKRRSLKTLLKRKRKPKSKKESAAAFVYCV